MLDLEERFMIRDLYRKGVTVSEIARRTGRDRKTIRKIISSELTPKPTRRQRKQATKLTPYEGYLKQRIGEGGAEHA
jgi:transposase